MNISLIFLYKFLVRFVVGVISFLPFLLISNETKKEKECSFTWNNTLDRICDASLCKHGH